MMNRGPVQILPGVLAAAILATAATVMAPYAPILGAPVIAILLGVAIRSVIALPAALRAGAIFAGREILQFAIVVSGLGVSLMQIVRTGLGTLPVTLGTIVCVLALAPIAARLLRVRGALNVLVACGTAICGASAIAAVSSVVEPTEDEIALATATIFAYNVAGVLLFPIAGHELAMSQQQFGLWAGTAINDTSSVVAAGFAYGPVAGSEATVVKLTRAMLIVPMVGALVLWRARRARSDRARVPWVRIVPWFIVWFVVAACINSTGVVPVASHAAIAGFATFAISVALAGIGLQTAPSDFSRAGWRTLAYGCCLWAIVAFSSLGFQRMLGS